MVAERTVLDTGRHGWPQYERAAAQADRFGALLDRFGAAPDVWRRGLVDLVAGSDRCLRCPHAAACALWVAERTHRTAPDFCPNARLFGTLPPPGSGTPE